MRKLDSPPRGQVPAPNPRQNRDGKTVTVYIYRSRARRGRADKMSVTFVERGFFA